MTDEIFKCLSQPICLLSKISRKLSYANPAMIELINTSASIIENGETSFDDCFSLVDLDCEFENFKSDADTNNSVLLKVMNGQSKYYHGYISNMSDEDFILLLTPSCLKKRHVENKFLRSHENVVDFIENAPICAHAFDDEGNLIWMNALQQKMLCCNEVDSHGAKVVDLLATKESLQSFNDNLSVLRKSDQEIVETQYSIYGGEGNVFQVINTSNARHDESGNIRYTRNFSRNETKLFFQHTLNNLAIRAESSRHSLESKDRFTRQLFHETKTPCQILMALKYTAKFNCDDDYKVFCIAIDSLSNLTLDMSILSGNINHGECMAVDTTMNDYAVGIISNLIEIGDVLGLAYQNEVPEFEFSFDDDFKNMHNINRLLPRAMYHLIKNSIQHSVGGDKIYIEGKVLNDSNQMRFSVINECDHYVNTEYIRNSYEIDVLNDIELQTPMPKPPSHSSFFSKTNVATNDDKQNRSIMDKGYGLKIVYTIAKSLKGVLNCKTFKSVGSSSHMIQFDLIIDINRARSQGSRRRRSSVNSVQSNCSNTDIIEESPVRHIDASPTAASESVDSMTDTAREVECPSPEKVILLSPSKPAVAKPTFSRTKFNTKKISDIYTITNTDSPTATATTTASTELTSSKCITSHRQSQRRGSNMSEYSVFSDQQSLISELDLGMSRLHGLVVEDSKTIQKLIKKGLNQAGYTCEIAHHGQMAIDILRKDSSKYDFITMDLRMPVMDGLEATRCIRQDLKMIDIPIIILSAEFGDLIKDRAKIVGGTVFVEKPVNMLSLTTLIEALCDRENDDIE